MGSESSLRTKELFNLLSLVLKARHLSGSAFCNFYRLRVPEQALGGIPLGFGIVIEDKPSQLLSSGLSCRKERTQWSLSNPVPWNVDTPYEHKIVLMLTSSSFPTFPE